MISNVSPLNLIAEGTRDSLCNLTGIQVMHNRYSVGLEYLPKDPLAAKTQVEYLTE